MTRTADKLGILIWSEVPVYWAEQFDNDAVFSKSKQQLSEEIRRDRNKASVILWSAPPSSPAPPISSISSIPPASSPPPSSSTATSRPSTSTTR